MNKDVHEQLSDIGLSEIVSTHAVRDLVTKRLLEMYGDPIIHGDALIFGYLGISMDIHAYLGISMCPWSNLPINNT